MINLFLIGVFCVGIGILWGNYFPINKNLWTSSYVALTGGLALIFLAVCYYIIDVKEYVRWSKPFIILGTNSIAVYILSEVVNLALIYTNITVAGGTSVALKSFVYENYFASWSGGLNGSLFYSLAYLMLWLGIASVLYKLGILIKI